MAGIYRSLYYADVTVGSGGRLTIRVEESPDGQRQMVIWKSAQQPEE
jgi:hypothetical protein